MSWPRAPNGRIYWAFRDIDTGPGLEALDGERRSASGAIDRRTQVMVRRIVAGLAGLLFVLVASAPLRAQKVEVSFGGGYTTSEGVTTEGTTIPVLGGYNKIDVVSGGAFNFTVGFNVTPQAQIEFLYGRQASKLRATGVGADLDLVKSHVDSYHVNFVYNWGEEDSKIRPFAFGGVGATYYGFGDPISPLLAGTNVDGNTQFSTNWGAGVKVYFNKNVGVKGMVRWVPTYIKSTSAGYWCDPYYGCWLVGDPDYSHQFEITGGITFRF
jgi:Outer membrane protein beta-barrel domain